MDSIQPPHVNFNSKRPKSEHLQVRHSLTCNRGVKKPLQKANRIYHGYHTPFRRSASKVYKNNLIPLDSPSEVGAIKINQESIKDLRADIQEWQTFIEKFQNDSQEWRKKSEKARAEGNELLANFYSQLILKEEKMIEILVDTNGKIRKQILRCQKDIKERLFDQ